MPDIFVFLAFLLYIVLYKTIYYEFKRNKKTV